MTRRRLLGVGATLTALGVMAGPGALAADAAPSRPNGFALPAGCRFVDDGTPSGAGMIWQIDCGAAANRAVRLHLVDAFASQGWTFLGFHSAAATWIKGSYRIVVSEGSGVPGSYPRLSQRPNVMEVTR